MNLLFHLPEIRKGRGTTQNINELKNTTLELQNLNELENYTRSVIHTKYKNILVHNSTRDKISITLMLESKSLTWYNSRSPSQL